jgi:hypothetical protein
VLALLPTLAPYRLMLAVALRPRGFNANLRVESSLTVRSWDTLSEGFWTARYLAAVPPRVLLMGQQVWPKTSARQSLQ